MKLRNKEDIMDINMEEQFQKFKKVIDEVDKFYFGLKNEYLGPINPTSIVSFGSDVFNINVLVIAESVPALYFPFAFDSKFALDSNHLEAVTVYLNENFEFSNYYPELKELMGLSLLVGDPEYSYDGTVNGASEFFKNKNWSFKVLY